MKRLQVGDECYVRPLGDKEIYRCKLSNLVGERCFVALTCNPNARVKGFFIEKGGKNHIVYPYPIIKQLAK